LKEKYKRHTKIYTDGSKKEEKDRYAVVWEKQTIKRKIHSQNSIYSADQSAIINVIYNTWRRRTEGYIHGQMMAVSDWKRTKNHKTQTIRKLMDQQGGKITLIWVREHVRITGKKNAPPQPKKPWTIEYKALKTTRENNTTTEMKEHTPHIRSNRDSQTMTRRD
jgi:hypothetical protein